jgi:hypothetical protein
VPRAAVRRALATQAGRTDYTYARPSGRPQPGIIRPAMREHATAGAVVDTSGSNRRRPRTIGQDPTDPTPAPTSHGTFVPGGRMGDMPSAQRMTEFTPIVFPGRYTMIEHLTGLGFTPDDAHDLADMADGGSAAIDLAQHGAGQDPDARILAVIGGWWLLIVPRRETEATR